MLTKRLMITLSTLLTLLIAFSRMGYSITQSEKQLLCAAQQGHSRQVAQLLQQGVSIEVRNQYGQTPLLLATRYHHLTTARLLIEAGADVNAKDKIKDSPYLYAGAAGYHQLLALMLAYGADLRSTNRYGGTALIPAAERGHRKTVALLIKAGIDVDHINHLHWTALLEAIILGDGSEKYVDIVNLLIKAKANVNLADAQGISPLQHAKKRHFQSIIRLLEQAGAH